MPSNDLPRLIEERVQDAINTPLHHYDGHLAYDIATEIVADIVDALTSDDVQDAAWQALETASPKASNGMVVRRMLHAALAAAGITQEGQG